MIDRRHVALCICIVATIGTSEVDEPPPVFLFEGIQDLQAGPFTLDAAQPERVWAITAQVVLPQEAEDADFESEIGARFRFTDPDNEFDPVSYRLNDCGGEMIAGPRVVSNDWDAFYVGFDGAFVDCAPQTTCTRAVCLEIEISNNEIPVEVDLTTWASVTASQPIEGEPIEVPIEIAIEEIEP